MSDQHFWRIARAAGLFLVLGFVTNVSEVGCLACAMEPAAILHRVAYFTPGSEAC